jgi:hypothetical protein
MLDPTPEMVPTAEFCLAGICSLSVSKRMNAAPQLARLRPDEMYNFMHHFLSGSKHIGGFGNVHQ